jgi:integrase
MALNIQQRMARTAGGERFSVLVAGDPPTPLFYPTVFAVEQRRSAGLAANTLWRDGQALMHLLIWADQAGIDLEQRFKIGDFLTKGEIASYARAARRTLPRQRSLVAVRRSLSPRPIGLTRLEPFRSPHVPSEGGVATQWASFRIWLARAYLTWLADRTSPYHALSDRAYQERKAAKEEMSRALDSHMSAAGRTSAPKEGLSEAQQERLLDVIRPDSPENPWSHPYVRVRNEALIKFLLALGTRKGEALKQKISHVDIGRLQVSIVRNPDDPDDTRRREPNVKRTGRIVPMDGRVADLLTDYISDWRSEVPGSERTDFLFLTIGGAPMSHEAVHKVFATLRAMFPELPSNLSAHLLRHTWNDNYSIQIDKNSVSATDEIRTRSYLMGWSETSGTAARYTQRSIRKRSAEHSRASQARLLEKKHGGH